MSKSDTDISKTTPEDLESISISPKDYPEDSSNLSISELEDTVKLFPISLDALTSTYDNYAVNCEHTLKSDALFVSKKIEICATYGVRELVMTNKSHGYTSKLAMQPELQDILKSSDDTLKIETITKKRRFTRRKYTEITFSW